MYRIPFRNKGLTGEKCLYFRRGLWYTVLLLCKEVNAMGENYITCKDEKGSINISEDVLVSIATARTW